MSAVSLAPAAELAAYSRPFLYDLAFSFRDYAAEADLLEAWCGRAGRRPRSVLELAAGPAGHALEFARRGLEVPALDLSQAMCDYASEKASGQGLPLEIVRADMREFRLPRRFDLAIQMIDSIAHLHTLEDMVRHLRAVAAHLEPGGCYILEMEHPRDFLGRSARTSGISQPWRVAGDGVEVVATWGSLEDGYDYLEGIFTARVEIRALREGHEVDRLVEQCRMRDWTAMEFRAALELAGGLEIAESHGDFALDAALDSTPASWRMIHVLRRAGAAGGA